MKEEHTVTNRFNNSPGTAEALACQELIGSFDGSTRQCACVFSKDCVFHNYQIDALKKSSLISKARAEHYEEFLQQTRGTDLDRPV